MKVEEKQSIIRAAQAYMEEKGISQNELSKLTGVNVSQLPERHDEGRVHLRQQPDR